MIELASALTLPIAKLLLKSWLGDTGADISVGLFQLGLKRLGDRSKARVAQHRAEEIADAVVADLERFFANEHVAKQHLAVAASALGDTIERHVDAAFLVHQKLNAKAIERALLDARPVGQIYRTAEPEHGWYKRLVKALAPRLREVAPEVPSYELERDATILERMAEVADKSEQIISRLEIVGDQTAHTKAMVEDVATREDRKRTEYETSYRKAVLSALDYVEILGLDIDRVRREVPLSIAYLSLTTKLVDLGRLDYETLLNQLPAFGNRLMIVGAAGSGKSTLLRWTAAQAAATEGKQEESASWRQVKDYLRAYFVNIGTEGHIRKTTLAHGSVRSTKIFQTDILSTQIVVRIFKELQMFPSGLRKSYVDKFNILANKPTNWTTDNWIRLYDDKGWRQRVPFLIRLRDIKSGLPRPDDLPAHLTTTIGNPPENWVRDLLQNGDALLLLDGVDEVPEGAARDAALAGIEEYVRQYEHCPVIVTSRPRNFDNSGLRAMAFWRPRSTS
jgi:nicotinamide riboside kinase